MMNKFRRNRVINAIVFFVRREDACEKIKLFELLFLLDFEHFKQTGKSVTGYEYQAWQRGPVPVALLEEWEHPGSDMTRVLEFIPMQKRNRDLLCECVRVKDGVKFDDEDFTPRQLRIMNRLAESVQNKDAESVVAIARNHDDIWRRVWSDGKGAYQTIPYEFAIPANDPHRDELLLVALNDRMRENADSEYARTSIH